MTPWKKIIGWASIGIVSLLMILLAAGFLLVRSRFFHRYLLAKIVEKTQEATGARVEVGNYVLTPSTLRADLYRVSLHGSESDPTRPLLAVDHLAVGLKIISLLGRKVVTESGRKLGYCHDLRAELSGRTLKVSALCVGRSGLVEHYGVPGFPRQDIRVQTQDGIRCQGHVRGRREGALWTMIDGHLESWPKPLQLVSPVVQHTGRGHYERTALEHTEGLQGFAESHVVGKQRSQPSLAEKCQPVDAMTLVGTQGRLQPFWQGRSGNPVKIL